MQIFSFQVSQTEFLRTTHLSGHIAIPIIEITASSETSVAWSGGEIQVLKRGETKQAEEMDGKTVSFIDSFPMGFKTYSGQSKMQLKSPANLLANTLPSRPAADSLDSYTL